jgi:hypothetical protein
LGQLFVKPLFHHRTRENIGQQKKMETNIKSGRYYEEGGQIGTANKMTKQE